MVLQPPDCWLGRVPGPETAAKCPIKLALPGAYVIFLHCSIFPAKGMRCGKSSGTAAYFKEVELHVIRSIADAKALEDLEVGVSDWIVIDQQMINQFAEATGDHQWIHVDQERAARELPNGKTIAHGYMTLSLIPALTKDFVHVENLTRALNFGCNKVRFYTMVPVGARVRARATVLQARKRGGALHMLSEIKVEVEGERKPACVAETLGMYFFEEETEEAAAAQSC
jgi:acyl dehydratase